MHNPFDAAFLVLPPEAHPPGAASKKPLADSATTKPKKKPASTKKSQTTKKSKKGDATKAPKTTASKDSASQPQHEHSGTDDDDDEEIPAVSFEDDGGDAYHAFSAAASATTLQGGGADPFSLGGAGVYDDDPFSIYAPSEEHSGTAGTTAGLSHYHIAGAAATKRQHVVPQLERSSDADLTRNPSSDSNEEDSTARGDRDDAHRSLSGRHLEHASSVDIPDDAVPPLSSPMPQHIQQIAAPVHQAYAYGITQQQQQQQQFPSGTNVAGTNTYGDNEQSSRSSAPLSLSANNAAYSAGLNPAAAWLAHELDLLQDDEESARDDVLLIETSDRDVLAYEAASEHEDVSFRISMKLHESSRSTAPQPAATTVAAHPTAATTHDEARTSEVVGELAQMIVEEGDKFRRKEDAVQSELAVLIQKKSLDDRISTATTTTAAASPERKTALEELASASPLSTWTNPPMAPKDFANSPGHQSTSPPRDDDNDDALGAGGFAPFPSFSQTSSATFAPIDRDGGDADDDDSSIQQVASPVLRDEDFPPTSLAKHVRNDSMYFAHHEAEHLEFIKEAIEHPEGHQHINAETYRRASLDTSATLDAAATPFAASAGRRRRSSVDSSLREGHEEPSGELHPSFLDIAETRGRDEEDDEDNDAVDETTPSSALQSALGKRLRKDSIYVARNRNEHLEYVKEGMEGSEEHGQQRIASLGSPNASTSPSLSLSGNSRRHQRGIRNGSLDVHVDGSDSRLEGDDVDDADDDGLRPSFVSSADLRGLSRFQPGDDDNDADLGVASPVLRDEDFPPTALSKHLRNDSIYHAHHHQEHLDYVKDGMEHPQEHNYIDALPGRRAQTDGISPQSAERRRRNSADHHGVAMGADDGQRGSHPTFLGDADDDDDEEFGNESSASSTTAAGTSELARNIRNDSMYFARNHQQHLEFVRDGIDHPEEHHHIASLSGTRDTLGDAFAATEGSIGRRRARNGTNNSASSDSVSFASDLRPSFVSSADLKGISSISVASSTADSLSAPSSPSALLDASAQSQPSPTSSTNATGPSIASPFAAAAAASGHRRNRQQQQAVGGVVFVDQLEKPTAENSLLLSGSVAVSSPGAPSTRSTGAPRQRVVMVEEPAQQLPSPRQQQQQQSQPQSSFQPIFAAPGNADVNSSTESSSPSFGPRVESFSEGSPSSALTNSASSFVLSGGDPSANRRLHRARDSMIIARDPNAHRNYVLEKSSERDERGDAEDERWQHEEQGHSFVSSHLAPPSTTNTRRGSVETLGSSTSTIDLPPSPTSHGSDPANDERAHPQHDPHLSSPFLGSSSTTSNQFNFTHDSIAIAHDVLGHRDYVRQRADTFSALSRMEWDAVEQQRRRLLDEDDQRAKADHIGIQLELQRHQFINPFAPPSDEGASGALARLRQLSAIPTQQSQQPPVSSHVYSTTTPSAPTVSLLERESALKWIQQEARARILQQQSFQETTSWVTEGLARDVMMATTTPAAISASPTAQTSHSSIPFHAAMNAALHTGTASASASSLGNDPNLLLEQRLAQVMGRLLTQDSVYLYQQALDAMLMDNAAWSLDAMNLYREFVATMPPKTREAEVQAPEGGVAQKETGTDARQPPGFTPSLPLGQPFVAPATAATQAYVDPPRMMPASSSSSLSSLHNADEENELLARLQRIRALRGETSHTAQLSTAVSESHNAQQPQPQQHVGEHRSSLVLQQTTSYGFHSDGLVASPIATSVPPIRRQQPLLPRRIYTPEVPRELFRSDAGAALRRIAGNVHNTNIHDFGSGGGKLPFSPSNHMVPREVATPSGFYRAEQQLYDQAPYAQGSPASSVISTPPPPQPSGPHHNGASLFPVFSKPSPKPNASGIGSSATKPPVAVLRWDVKRSGNVLISQSGTLTMSDSSRALKALHEDGTLAGQDKSTIAIPMFALGTVGISQGDLVFEVRFELRPSREAFAAASPTPTTTRSGPRLLATSALRPGQRAALHKTFIGVASKYYRGASRSTPAYLLCSDGTISATSALSNPESTSEAVPYGRPLHCSAVVTIHLSFSRRELSFAVDGIPQGVAFKFQQQDDPEPLFPVVVFTGDGDSCAFQAPTIAAAAHQLSQSSPITPTSSTPFSGARRSSPQQRHHGGGGGQHPSPIVPRNVSRPLY